jgi:hypothetical protein
MGKPWEKDLQNCGKNHIYASLEEARNWLDGNCWRFLWAFPRIFQALAAYMHIYPMISKTSQTDLIASKESNHKPPTFGWFVPPIRMVL